MKIGIVSQSYYPRYGGVTEHVHHTAVELRKMGHDVRIITSQFRNSAETNHSFGVDRVGYNILIPFNRAFVDVAVGMRLRQQLRGLFRKHQFDILHVHCPTAPTLPIFAIQAASCPVVGTFHTTSGRSFLQNAFHGVLKKVIGKLDARIAVSKTAEQSAHMYYPGDYHVIPNGVDIERFDPDAKPFEEWQQDGITNLLFVGRLDPRKGVQRLIDAMPRAVEKSGGTVRLLIIGDSYLRAKFESSVAPAARDFVHFLGHVPSADLPRWYATGDVFVSPASGNESFGIVLLEAMAAGCPVVASDIPGYRSVIEPGINGVMVPPLDDDALADKLVELARDPIERKRLSERGRARAMEFAWPAVTQRIEAVYHETLAGKSAVTTPA